VPLVCLLLTRALPTRCFSQGADRAFAFTSGMAALTAVTRLLRSGQRVLSGDDIYGA
jgi:cystathionine beta-lyase/cystathionine gamma-synthase